MNAAPEPSDIYLKLRDRTLSLDPTELGFAPSQPFPHVWAVLMETGYEVGFATLASLVDGTTTLYYSTGGGMLGSADFTPLAEASKALVAQAETLLPLMHPVAAVELPGVGQVGFVLITYNGKFAEVVSEKSLASGKHALSPLFARARETITQLRNLSEKKRK